MVQVDHRCIKQMLCADTYVDDECRMAFFQSAAEPQEVLVAPAYLVLTGVKLASSGLEGEVINQYQDTMKLYPWYLRVLPPIPGSVRMTHRPPIFIKGPRISPTVGTALKVKLL